MWFVHGAPLLQDSHITALGMRVSFKRDCIEKFDKSHGIEFAGCLHEVLSRSAFDRIPDVGEDYGDPLAQRSSGRQVLKCLDDRLVDFWQVFQLLKVCELKLQKRGEF